MLLKHRCDSDSMRLSEKRLNGVESICKNKGFNDFLEWLREERAEVLENVATHRDIITIHQLQGQAMILNDLVNLLEAIAKK